MKITNTYTFKDKKWKYTGNPSKDIESLTDFCTKIQKKSPNTKLGKIVYKVCMTWWPEEADMFTGSVIDPSKNEDKVNSFIKSVLYMVDRRLVKEWNEAHRGY